MKAGDTNYDKLHHLTPLPASEGGEAQVDSLSNFIRIFDGNHSKGAGELAEHIISLGYLRISEEAWTKIMTAINDMLGGHYNLYKDTFGENSNPEDDICRKQLIEARSIIEELKK